MTDFFPLVSPRPSIRLTLPRALSALILAVGIAFAHPAAAQTTLWYNGDYDASDPNRGGVLNNYATNNGRTAAIFDNFVVTNPTGWNLSDLWSNNFVYGSAYTGPVSQAQWSIRSGMSVGNGGTILYSGVSSATQTDTGLKFGTSSIYKTDVGGLNLNLAEGAYWLQVSPVVSGNNYEEWYNANTNGLNAIGTPQGNDGNAFINYAPYYDYENTTTAGGSQPNEHDFSMGVAGTVNLPASAAPEPSQFAALEVIALALSGLLVRAGRRRCTVI